MVVLRPSQIDNPRAYFHTVKHRQSVFRAVVVNVLAKPKAFRVELARFLHKVEGAQPAVPLQQVFDLVFVVLTRQSTDK
jgi:hypothetical protein